MIVVGNDVVDLRDPRCQGRASNDRFVSRIFAASEATAISAAPDPDGAVWLLWAAKEVAFKVVSKLRRAPPAFVHARFVVTLDEAATDRSGVVAYGSHRVAFSAAEDGRRLHAVGWGGVNVSTDRPPANIASAVRRIDEVLPGGSDEDLSAIRQSLFSARERVAVHSLASAAVRIAARGELSGVLGVPADRIEIVCDGPVGRAPPRLLVAGEPSGLDVSLSHHGRWVAWAAVPEVVPVRPE